VGVPFLDDEGISSEPTAQTAPQELDELEQTILEQHPGLTPERLREMMQASGF
jgi:hypothetical protein